MKYRTPVHQAANIVYPFALALISLCNTIDGAAPRLYRYIRRRRREAIVAVAMLASGCAASQPRPTEPPAPRPPQIERLDCGGKACTITTSGNATIVWVQE